MHKANFLKSWECVDSHCVTHISLDLLKTFPFRKEGILDYWRILKMFQNECSIGKENKYIFKHVDIANKDCETGLILKN